jgi:putative SOS response-associated peptidase YedK
MLKAARQISHGPCELAFDPIAAPKFASWLDGSAGAELLRSAPENLLQVWPVSKRVNRSADDNNDPDLIERIALN